MTHEQLLDALAIDPDERADGEVVYPLHDLTPAGIVQRLGDPVRGGLGAQGRRVLIYLIDDGWVLIAGYERDGVITRGMVYINA